MEKISWTDHVRNEEVLLSVNEQRNILHEISKRKVNWIGHILGKNCFMYIYIYIYICWTDHVRNEEVLLRVNEQRNILQEMRKRKANLIGHILRRNCLLKQVKEGNIKGEMEVTRRRGRRRKKLLDDLKDRRGYCHLKEEALDRTVWRNRFGGGFGPVVKQNTEWMNEYIYIYVCVCVCVCVCVTTIPLEAWTRPDVSRNLKFSDFKTVGTLRW